MAVSVSLSIFYFYAIWIVHLTYLALFVGVVTTVPKLVDTLNVGLQTMLCGVLMYRFHPFRTNYQLHTSDASFIFGSATLLFVNVVLINLSKTMYVGKYIRKAQEWVNQKKEIVQQNVRSQLSNL